MTIALNRTGRLLVARLHGLSAKLQIGESDLAGGTTTVFSQTVVFKAAARGYRVR